MEATGRNLCALYYSTFKAKRESRPHQTSASLTSHITLGPRGHSSQGVSELKGRLYYEEPTFRSPFSASRSAQQNSILEVQRLNLPLRPQLASTVLNPTYTPRSRILKARPD
ncbi:centrosomal protein of 68 kDa isoform X3 [Lates japonicus]|uniref:Centrosomal protein of 68 kDa isoform X3 n=1 Tax=Lates japonicus TaxID=270547 RepID=A0AAD3NK88_LATJO|nr:centrosomal protein of 68 kDa isoform X3 [Lates japonicus]